MSWQNPYVERVIGSIGGAGYDFPFQFAIQTRPIITLDKGKWLKVNDVVNKLTMTKHIPNRWQLAFRQSMRQLSEEDGALLKRLLEERA